MSDHRDGFVPVELERARRYRAAGYWRGETISDVIRDGARRWPTAHALVDGSRRLSYAELDAAVDRCAAGLAALGIRPGERIVLQLPNCVEFAIVLLGSLRAGAIPVLCLPAHREAEIRHLAHVSGAVALVVADRVGAFDYTGLARSVQAAVPGLRHVLVHGDPGEFRGLSEVLDCADAADLPCTDPSDIALLLVSGGTTGLPKLIARTHDDYLYNARASAQVCELTNSDVYLVSLPAAHNFPLACPGILGTLAVGGTCVFIDDASPENAFAAIDRHGVTITAVVPPLAQLWCAATEWEQADLSTLRLLQVGGARLAETNAREVRPRLGATLQQVFGMAEGLLNFTRLDDPDEVICTTQGRPLSPHDEVRVVDREGVDVPTGTEGELLTRGPYTIRGYYRADEHNARAFTADGFYRSGDLVRQLPSGHLVVTGRMKDVINRGGENIAADELETHLLAHPAVRHAAAVALPDSALGERLCAAIVPAGSAPTLSELKAFLAARGLATYKLPDLVHLAESLPTTAVGKIDKRALVAMLTA
ncbi:AMP-binding protein [Skermania sp. ID1734]|uniref:(2,3-dihydroxybenzoyl)adenylate synthase n=1 Tax=Skermania sp. ID1734 TaxID=2597516 RepID=UPI00117DE938|nr:AMP-binding protein [Skermania sp. ID1734]TSE01422.1 AMP-binding protein [Skermania sp. ID1734]